MTRSIRLHWISRFFGNGQREVKCISQGLGRQQIALQQAGNLNNAVSMYAIDARQQRAGSQYNFNNAGNIACAGDQLKIDDRNVGRTNDWQSGVAQSQYAGLSAGVLTHDGSFKLFKWDTAQGRMVPFELSTPILARLVRSLDAFWRSWRLG